MNPNFPEQIKEAADELDYLPIDDGETWLEVRGPNGMWLADIERTGDNAFSVAYLKRCDYFREPFEYTHAEEVSYAGALAFLRYHLQKYSVEYDVREKDY